MSWNVHTFPTPREILGAKPIFDRSAAVTGRIERMQPMVLFLYEQSRAELDGERLKISMPVRVAAIDLEALDRVLDAELERVQSLLSHLLRPFNAEVTESWVADEDDEPILDMGELQAPAEGPALTLIAYWLLESPIGFPRDQNWLTDWARQTLLQHTGT